MIAVIKDAALRGVLYVQPRDVPSPVSTAPPGSEKMTMVLGWALWVVIALAVLGVFIVAGKMILSHRRGEGGEHASGLAFVLMGCVLIGSASGIVKMFV